MSKLNIVILAAGVGRRMNSSLPKVLHTLADRPLLLHVIDTARTLSPEKICIVYGHGGDTVRETITDEDLLWAKQNPQLGTGHAVMQSLPFLDEEGITLVLYGDVPLVSSDTLKRLCDVSEGKHGALLTAILEEPSGYGRIIRTTDDNISAIVEEKDADAAQKSVQEINTGVMIIPNNYLHTWLPQLKNNNAQQEYYLTDLVAMAVSHGVKVMSAQPAALWEIMGVNSKRQLAELERIYQLETANTLLEKGVRLADPSRIDVRGKLKCGRDVDIDVNCIFEGDVTLADQVKIGANCILKKVTVAAGAVIAPYSHIEDAEIGAACKIGPYARIRPGTILADKVYVGNFVEIKKSKISTGSKANHLSYIGDTTIGKNVNIGAGTITCNYDGAFKHQTVIEDDVFVGSDTQLVAPVKISKGSTIGAGSTITKDTPEDKLSLSRSIQKSVSSWTRPVKPNK